MIHQYIRYQNAKSRQGSHKTKSRSEVSGRSKKPFSQKGTGNARQGSNKPPNFRGGAVSMGPQNRDHSFNLNKKEKKLALKSALSTKVTDKKVIIIANHVFLSGASFKNKAPRKAESIGAIATIIRVLATLVFWIEIIKVTLHTEKLIA